MTPDHDPLPGHTDEDLLAGLRAGRREWFGPLVKRYERELYGYLKRYVGDADLAADVFQNTFLQVFLKVQQYEPGRPAFASLRRTQEDLAALAGGGIEELPARAGEYGHAALAHLERHLFADVAPAGPPLDGAVRFFEGAGARGSLELVAESIRELAADGAPLEQIAPTDMPWLLLRLLSVVQPAILVLAFAALGLWAAPKTGLEAPVVRAWAEGRPLLPALRPQLPAAIIAGLAVALGRRAPVLVVVQAGLGTLNAAALTAEALRTRGLRCAGAVIGSWPAEPDLAAGVLKAVP